MQDAYGYNPYKTGVVGGSDSHNTGVPYRQGDFYGGHGGVDGTIQGRMLGHLFAGMDVRLENPAGVTGVWAEENTCASLFEAMQRKETFAASGPHIRVRFFGGWEYPPELVKQKDWVKIGYAKGVPMGGDLPPPKAKAPAFVVWAVKDPTSGNLDRVQIVKGWAKNGQSFEKIFDVVWAGEPEAGSAQSTRCRRWAAPWTSPGPATPIPSASVELKAVWKDPEFDPSLDAFYYARVLEIPTPRWTTIQAKELGIPPPSTVAATIRSARGAHPSGTRRAQKHARAPRGEDRRCAEAEGRHCPRRCRAQAAAGW